MAAQRNKAPVFDAVLRTAFSCVGVRVGGEHLTELVFLPPQTAPAKPRGALAQEACRQIMAFSAEPDFVFDLPLAECGTAFQRRVWAAIAAIPRGRTRGYGDIASELGSAARAVGQACGANFFPLVIPCHRVMGVVAAAGIGGFAHHDGGFHLQVKRWLLTNEGHVLR